MHAQYFICRAESVLTIALCSREQPNFRAVNGTSTEK